MAVDKATPEIQLTNQEKLMRKCWSKSKRKKGQMKAVPSD